MATNNALLHAWANQTGRDRKSYSMSYVDGLLYSRSTVVANRLNSQEALFSLETYSKSTARQISDARRAFSGSRYTVPNLQPGENGSPGHVENYESYAPRIGKLMENARRARYNRNFFIYETERLVQEAQSYRTAFCPNAARITVADAFFNCMREQIVQAQREAEARAAAQLAVQLAEEADHRAAWLAGQSVRLRLSGHPLLRLAPNNAEMMETSWGASVPLCAAKRVATMAHECLIRGVGLTPTTPVGVGDFRLTRIDADGTIVVGCHTIPWAETDRFAKSIGYWN